MDPPSLYKLRNSIYKYVDTIATSLDWMSGKLDQISVSLNDEVNADESEIDIVEISKTLRFYYPQLSY